jgi:hypothetical protein
MPARKSESKKTTGGRKYSPESSASVEREMKAMKQGKLKSGSGQKVTNPKQAIAIGLSEARREGAEQPDPPKGTASAEKEKSSKKTATKKTATKKTAVKKETRSEDTRTEGDASRAGGLRFAAA